MALFTICATTHDAAARACAIVTAVSEQDALRTAERLRRAGDLLHVPAGARLTTRRASRREAEDLRAWLTAKPAAAETVGSDDGFAGRARRRLIAFFEKLWAERPSAAPKPAAAASQSPLRPDEFEFTEETSAPPAKPGFPWPTRPAAPSPSPNRRAAANPFDAAFDGLSEPTAGSARRGPK